jgi:hypothetical protein
MREMAMVLVAGVAVLAGCSKAPSKSEPTVAKAPAPAAVFTAPHPKLGLWAMDLATDAGPGVKLNGQICIDAATEHSAFQTGPQSHGKNCSAPDFSPSPSGGAVFDVVCNVNGRKITTHSTATGDFTNSYSIDTTTTMDPPLPGGIGPGHTHLDAHWVGPCKPGQRPGQMSMKLGGVGAG